MQHARLLRVLSLVMFASMVLSLGAVAFAQQATEEPTPGIDPTHFVTEEPTAEATHDATAEATGEATDMMEATAAPTQSAADQMNMSAAEIMAMCGTVTIERVSSYETGVFDEGASEIVAHDPASQQLFIINGNDNTVHVVSIADVSAPQLVTQIDLSEYGNSPTHVAVQNSIMAVSVENDTDPGMVVFADTAGEVISAVTVGVLPDQLIFTPDYTKVLTANEGQPSDDYTTDPEGSVSIIDLGGGVASLSDADVTTVTFEAFNADGDRADELPADVRIYGPGATVAQDLEPEYVAISPDNLTAFVSLQENNALATIDIASASVTSIVSFGFKDHSLPGNGLDVSNEDGEIRIENWPVFGMYQPDAIVAVEANGEVYIITANEGDTRDYDGFSEETEVQEVTLDPDAFPNAADLIPEAELGKLEIVTTLGDTDGDGDYDELYIPGARSFSVFDTEGNLVYDSGDQLEQITAEQYPDDFNATNDENGSFDDRSDNKGPEPEGLAVGTIEACRTLFVGLERIGGVMVFNINDPEAPMFSSYVNTRDFSGDAEAGTAGDLGPEGLIFVTAENSPTGEPLLVVANEVSGSTTIFRVFFGE